MAKNSRKQIEEDEKTVIKILMEKGTQNIQNIANKAGFSRQKAWRMIKRLEKLKTIWGYVAVVDVEKLNNKSYIIMINIDCDKTIYEAMADEAVESALSEIGITVQDSCYTHGTFNWIMRISASDTKHLTLARNILMGLFPDTITDMETMEVLVPIKTCSIKNPNASKEMKQFY